ncbi:MAG: iron ABC transporter permease [Pygmaiobacter massiliensis]|nr:iron ABC transporter permease [Pygmaiobacter massiliensis]
MNHRSVLRQAICFAALILLTALLTAANVLQGSVDVSVGQVLNILVQGAGSDTASQIIWNIRLPRALAALVLGGALSVSGFLLQTFFQNPIAGPFVLGISSGAKLVVALVMIGALSRGLVLGSAALIAAAFIGSLVVMGFILAVSGRVKKMSLLVVAGVMVGYICSAITDILVTFADDSNIVNLHNWSMGSFSGISWQNLAVLSAVTGVSLFCTIFLAKPMSAYQLGESYAASVGVHIRLFRLQLVLFSSLLSACVTAFAGPVSFVGIAVPHLVKSLFKTAKPLCILPACFLGGAAFCLACDLIARTLFAPTELSIGSVTAVFGAPVVIWIMLRRQANRNGGEAV